MDGDSGYDLSDPKSPDYHDRMSDVYDNRDKLIHYLQEHCLVLGYGNDKHEYRIVAYKDHPRIEIVGPANARFTFSNTREFRTFLKMLVRLDERL